MSDLQLCYIKSFKNNVVPYVLHGALLWDEIGVRKKIAWTGDQYKFFKTIAKPNWTIISIQ